MTPSVGMYPTSTTCRTLLAFLIVNDRYQQLLDREERLVLPVRREAGLSDRRGNPDLVGQEETLEPLDQRESPAQKETRELLDLREIPAHLAPWS